MSAVTAALTSRVASASGLTTSAGSATTVSIRPAPAPTPSLGPTRTPAIALTTGPLDATSSGISISFTTVNTSTAGASSGPEGGTGNEDDDDDDYLLAVLLGAVGLPVLVVIALVIVSVVCHDREKKLEAAKVCESG